MAEWVKLHSKIAESEDIAVLQAQDPNAALLFLMSLPVAAPWGILPRSPAVFRGRVAPMFDLSLSEVEACLQLIIAQGMYREYTDRDGKAHLYVTTWTQNQTRRWDRVGAPPCDLPPNWVPPDDMARAIVVSDKSGRWLTREALEACLQDAESIASLRRVLDESRTQSPGLRVPDESRPCPPKRGRVEKESLENDNTNDKRPLSEPAHDAGPDPAEPDQLDCTDQPSQPPAPKLTKKQQAAEKAAKREAELQAAIATVRADLPPELLPTLDAWLENLASHNESGTMTTGRVLSATTEFANLVHVHALTTAAIQHGVAAAIGAVDNKDGKDGVTAIRYVLSAAKGYGRDGARASPSDAPRGLPREEFILISDGTIRKASDWDLTQRWQVGEMKAAGNWDVETGRTLHPTPGYTCVDGFFYIDGTVENRVPNGRAGRVT